jgi:hypothetical protein
MGGACESCQSVEGENNNTLLVNLAEEDTHLQPEDFYNAATKEIANRLGPFKYDNDDIPPFVTKGPIEM